MSCYKLNGFPPCFLFDIETFPPAFEFQLQAFVYFILILRNLLKGLRRYPFFQFLESKIDLDPQLTALHYLQKYRFWLKWNFSHCYFLLLFHPILDSALRGRQTNAILGSNANCPCLPHLFLTVKPCAFTDIKVNPH